MSIRLSSLLLVLLAPLILPATAAARQTPSPAEDAALLARFEELRVADVVDGMDMVGLRGVGLVDTRFQALGRPLDETVQE